MRGQPAYLTEQDQRERRDARRLMSAAIRNGRLVRGECERKADGYCRGRIAGHHRNGYHDPNVVWLCAMHHGIEHYQQDRARRMAPYERGR